MKAQHGLYEYDAVSRLRDSQLGDPKVNDIRNYIVRGMLWEAFKSETPAVLLIDEIDKADIEFPNDLLRELDRMEFYVYETQELVQATHRPLVIITSNNEKELPDAFLRRCVFHFIDFPDQTLMRRIVGVHHPDLDDALIDQSLSIFFELRNLTRLRKRPSTSELIDWLAALKASGVKNVKLDEQLPFVGALLKREQDLQTLSETFAGGKRSRA
jgi:MoxR-like ATPase